MAVLDTNGNLILHVGKYGNVDDGVPLISAQSAKSADSSSLRSIGGDEVALFYPAYVGADTDRRLFVGDLGNARIVSVKLGYHVNEVIPLKNVPDQGVGK